ncbi:MAG TPA: lipid A export permease/ATP-binding protein MsbA [Candidatus Tenderia sp.]|nr:lipid A export permease/ATP-binding protein MsbA [Candidatus Tenderia sp.]
MTTANPEIQQGKQLYGRLLSHVKPYWRIFAIAIIAMVGGGLAESGIPVLLKPLLDESFVHKNADAVQTTMIWLILLFVARGLVGFVSQVGIAWVGHKIIFDIRSKMFEKLIHMPQDYYDEHSTGTLISKITYNTDQVANSATNALVVIVKDSITVIALLGWMFYLDWQLSLIFLIIGPIIGVIVKGISKRLRRFNMSLQSNMGHMTQTLTEAANGTEVIKIFGGEKYERDRFDKVANWVRRYNMKAITVSAINVPVVQLIGILALALIVYIVSLKAEADMLSVGGFVSFFGAMAMLFSPIKRLTKVNEQLQRGLAAAQSIFELLDEPGECDSGTISLPRARGQLQFQHLHFRYPHADEDALHDINLDIQPGETIALVGQSGSGKSTLASLIPRFHTPTAGKILLDGHELGEIRLKELRANIALVSQKVVLFNDTIAANIAYGSKRDASEAEISAAARAAHAMEFIEKLPEGLNALVGENGSRLSGGQRQRIAIARALLKDAPILIMDEATSALDSQSEQHVQAALETLRKDRTAIIIAHRLSTIENADRIAVMDKGRVVEVGSHQELLSKGGAYARLYQAQFSDISESQ